MARAVTAVMVEKVADKVGLAALVAVAVREVGGMARAVVAARDPVRAAAGEAGEEMAAVATAVAAAAATAALRVAGEEVMAVAMSVAAARFHRPCCSRPHSSGNRRCTIG